MSMEAEGKHSSILPLSVLLLAFGLGGIYLYDQPYSSLRPEEGPSNVGRSGSVEDIDARLWEDPFEAVGRVSAVSPCTEWSFTGREAFARRGTDADAEERRQREAFLHLEETASRQLIQLAYEVRRRAEGRIASSSGAPLAILPVLVPGDPYFEPAEKRRRTRYAVLAGLAASGYVPESSDRIGLVDTCWNFAGRLDPTAGRAVPVPYEWLVPDPFTTGGRRPGAAAVLVLWLDESEFGTDPWSRIDDLLAHMVGYCQPQPWGHQCLDGESIPERFAFRLIGPASSGTLARMIDSPWRPRPTPARPERKERADEVPPVEDPPEDPEETTAGDDPYLESLLALVDLYLEDDQEPVHRTRDLELVLASSVEPLAGAFEEPTEIFDLDAVLRRSLAPIRQTLRSIGETDRGRDVAWPDSAIAAWERFLRAEVELRGSGKRPLREVVDPSRRLCHEIIGVKPEEAAIDEEQTGRQEIAAESPSAQVDLRCESKIVTLDRLAGSCRGPVESLVDRLSCAMLRHQLDPDRSLSLSEQAGHLVAELRAIAESAEEPRIPREKVAETVSLWAVDHLYEVLGTMEPPADPIVPHLTVYNNRATAPASLLVGNVEGREGGEAWVGDGSYGFWEQRLRVAMTGSVGHSSRADGRPDRFRYLSVVRPDDEVAAMLVDELRRRRVDVCSAAGEHHVALIGEWDTLYGRALPLTLEAEILRCRSLAEGANGVHRLRSLDDALLALVEARAEPPARVHRFQYLRGLDGVAPAVAENETDERSGGKEAEGRSEGSDVSGWLPWSRLRLLERPRGNPQFDYMRRLTDHLSSIEERIGHEGGELRAIGVVGTDTYDKLLVLQALRRRFPRTLFFTTDLDARMLHSADYGWNRNLLIGSSFGLSLDEELQRQAPPFRDGYQTATYLSARLAMASLGPEDSPPARSDRHAKPSSATVRAAGIVFGEPRFEPRPPPVDLLSLHGELERSQRWTEPRLFEVARRGAYDITPVHRSDLTPSVHPERPSSLPTATTLGWLAFGLGSGLMLLVPLSAGLRRVTLERWRRGRPAEVFAVNVFTLLVIVAAALFAWAAYRTAVDPAGEPFELWEGISVWPTEAIRLAAALLSLFFIGCGAMRLAQDEAGLTRRFGLPQGERASAAGCWARWWRVRKAERQSRSVGRWLRGFGTVIPGFRSLFGHGLSWPRTERSAWWTERERVSINAWRCAGIELSEGGTDETEPPRTVSGEDVWDRYRYLGRLSHRLTRIVPMTLLYYGVGFTLIQLFGEPHVPHRGGVSHLADVAILHTSIFLSSLLTFFVVDATRLCERFIEALAERPTQWPEEVVQRGIERRPIDANDAGDVIDLELIADRTEVVGNLILYPFVVLFLMIVSRASFFDNWDWPIGLLLIFGMSSAYALACAVILRRAAEKARQKTIEHLRANLYEAVREEESARAEQIRLLIEEARELHRGAFSHWTRHPVVKAVLLPFSGVGVLALIELLAVIGR